MQAQLVQYGDDQAKASPDLVLFKHTSNTGCLHRKDSRLGDGAQRISPMDSLDGENT